MEARILVRYNMNIIADGLEIKYLTNGMPIQFTVNYFDEVKDQFINLYYYESQKLPVG